MAKIITPTVVIVEATLGTKTITENGTHSASEEGLDGFSDVMVDVPPTLFRQLVDHSITNVTANDLAGVTELGPYAFYQCRSLLNIEIPDTIVTIGSYTLGNTGISSIRIPHSVTKIVNASFSYCRKLKEAIIEANELLVIEQYSFTSDNALKKFIVHGETPPILQHNAFSSISSTFPFYVSNPDTYKSATNWSTFASRIFPLVSAVVDLDNIDTTTYTKACVIGADESYKEYAYDGSQWNAVV